MSCLNCLYDNCKVLVCDNEASVSLPATADIAGEYLIVLQFENTARVIRKTFALNETITFTANKLNENYCYEGYIQKPDGTALIIINAEGTYSGFRFCTLQEYNL
jgi:hypothetical protein